MNAKQEIDHIVDWMQSVAQQAHAKGFVLGISGGIDSAVCAALAKRAFPDDTLGLIMPCESMERDEQDARIVAEALNLNVEKVDLTASFNALVGAAGALNHDMARSNIKPRLRMTTLYYYAQAKGYLVLGCSNASEFYVGYYTKYGDSGSDLMPIASYLKDEVYELAWELGIPEAIINKAPSAGLWANQTDEVEMGFDYDTLNAHIRGERVDETIAAKIEAMHERAAHKRQFAPRYER
ncbi:NAD(+) synthase [Peptoniphilus equinus]|uniref:NH(3)-dependent NAD(+) synthetase n=1 Tax=Peptoniphilus equinus TaxID=3016343 RepID=A0ABY7QSI8_9FIRM|nr:NAD(+) synthase [Peptoniphilus equinus]WBW49291.1 NAD(+) synthase [Peptoniphilus equinus]